MPASPTVALRLTMDGDLRRFLLKKAGSSQAAIARQLLARGYVTTLESGQTIVSKVLNDAYPTTLERGQEMVRIVRRLIADATGKPLAKLWPDGSANGKKKARKR